MAGHAKLSPSASSRWIACPGSIKLCEGLPRRESGSAAMRGTYIHQIGEDLLNGIEHTVGEVFKVEGVTGFNKIDKDMLKEAQGYFDYVMNLTLYSKDDYELITEMKVDLTDIAPNTFGHSDTVLYTAADKTLHIVDLKTGGGLVNAFGNSQLMLYGYGAYMDMCDFYDIEFISTHIVQENVMAGRNNSSANMSVAELLEYIEDTVKPAAKEALSDNAKCVAGEKQCQWCDAASFCKVAHKFSSDIVEDMFATVEDEKDVKPKDMGDYVTIEEAVKFVKNAKMIKQMVTSYEARIEKDLQDGKTVEGFKLVMSKHNKKWCNELDAYTKLKTWGSLDEVAPRKLLTVNQMTILLGQMTTKKSNIFEKLWTKPEGQPVMAADSDKRPPIKAIVESFENIDEDDEL